MKLAITAVFLVTYLLIAGRRLAILPIGRVGGALAGAVAMVALGALSPEESYAAIDHDTIVLLLGMMLLTVYLERVGFFTRLGGWLIHRARTPWRLLLGIALLSGVSSAFLVNDTVCVFLTPLVLATCVATKLPLGPYLMAVATSANIGSAATLVGNPQNMIIGHMSQLSFLRFAALSALPAALGLGINALLLRAYFKAELPAEFPRRIEVADDFARVPSVLMGLEAARRFPVTVLVVGGVVAAFLAGLHMGYAALAGVLVLMLFERQDPRSAFGRVDWPLLMFFSCLFIVVKGFTKTGYVDAAWAAVAPYMHFGDFAGVLGFTAVMTLASNIVSNVPLVLLTGPHLGASGAGATAWVTLGFVTTIAGNLTLVGSVANLIVAEAARDHYHLGFREYLRFGAVSTVLVLGAGVPLIILLAHLTGW